jgi:hypothetical protein
MCYTSWKNFWFCRPDHSYRCVTRRRQKYIYARYFLSYVCRSSTYFAYKEKLENISTWNQWNLKVNVSIYHFIRLKCHFNLLSMAKTYYESKDKNKDKRLNYQITGLIVWVSSLCDEVLSRRLAAQLCSVWMRTLVTSYRARTTWARDDSIQTPATR